MPSFNKVVFCTEFSITNNYLYPEALHITDADINSSPFMQSRRKPEWKKAGFRQLTRNPEW